MPTDIDTIEVRVEGSAPQTLFARAPLVGSFPVALPVTVGLTPKDATVHEVSISAVGLRGGVDVLEVAVITQFVTGRRAVLRLHLSRACVGMDCGEGMTCSGGHCIAATIDAATLEHYVGGPITGSDAGSDGGATDAGADLGSDGGAPDLGPAPECTGDATCSDHDACNGVEHCVEMHCAPGTPVSCDDGVACTTDACTASTGACTHTPDDTTCTTAPSGTCSVTLGCQYPMCNTMTCRAAAGACETAMCVGTTCTRVSTCTGGQICCGGSCAPAGCDDGNPCTNDACGATGCTHANNTVACTDGNACTTGDHCAGGACTPTGAMNCDDGNPCTNDSCSAGTCSHSTNAGACDDGNACTSGDVCTTGTCTGSPISCDDGLFCTIDSCVAATGCAHAVRHCASTCYCDEDLNHCECDTGCHPICP